MAKIRSKPYRFIKALFLLTDKSTWRRYVEIAELTKLDYAITVSWSQGSEDLALIHAVQGLKTGTYIDIGAHHPSRFSVTRHLYQLGWHGVNVDANADLMDEFFKVRTRDQNLCFAVGMNPTYEFTVFEEPAISTLDPEWRESALNQNNQISKTVKVEGRKLRKILDDFEPKNCINLLSIDAEGSDLEVLESIEFKTLENKRFPTWLLLEATPPVSRALQTPAVKLAMKWGYEPYMVLPMSTLLKYVGK